MPSGFHHVTLNVTDLARARAFYEGVLGFEVDQDFPGYKLRVRVGESRVRADLCHDPLGGAVLCFRDPDNIALEFFEETAPGAVPLADPGA